MVTYDEVDALAAFADEFGITYPMLSDPDSVIIERFGILNTLVDPEDHPWFGVPFPGSYVIDPEGVVTSKFFENELTVRPNAHQLLRAALGEPVTIEPAPSQAVAAEVAVEVAYDGTELMPTVMHDLLITLRVPEGQHLYGEPVPDGMIATSVVIDNGVSVIHRQPSFPPTREHQLSGSGEVLHVYEADVQIQIPIVYRSSDFFEGVELDRVAVTGTIRWQSCDDDICHLPVSRRFEIVLPVGRSNLPEFVRTEDSKRMNFNEHFQRMTDRRHAD